MRSTARALSVALAVGASLAIAGPAAADPAEAGPGTFSMTCDPVGDPAGGGEDTASSVDGACPAAPGKAAQPWSAHPEPSDHGDAPGNAHGDTPGDTHGDTHADTHSDTHPLVPEYDDHGCREPRAADGCAPAAVQHGVGAGTGGSLGGSVPALVAGGILVAGAGAGAAYRLGGRLRRTGGPGRA
ncbi:hypothetical protein ACWCV9_12840 [Streptomyces sp. NPDC001606]